MPAGAGRDLSRLVTPFLPQPPVRLELHLEVGESVLKLADVIADAAIAATAIVSVAYVISYFLRVMRAR